MCAKKLTVKKKLKEYHIFEFLYPDDNESKTKEIEISPNSWISFNAEEGQLYVKFMPPPYNLKSRKVLKQLILLKADAPQEWPKYQINLLGHAETYEEALKAVKKLSREEYAYSTADEYTPQEKAEEIKCLIAKKSSEHVDVLIVPTMDEEIEDPDTVTNSRSSIIVPETTISFDAFKIPHDEENDLDNNFNENNREIDQKEASYPSPFFNNIFAGDEEIDNNFNHFKIGNEQKIVHEPDNCSSKI